MAKDKYHYLVKNALILLNWQVTDPFYIPTLTRKLEVDLGAERLIAADKDKEKIAIEIKSFIGLSDITEFYKALGQFNYYKLALEDLEPDRVLYLAVPLDTYDSLFLEPISQKAIERYGLKIIVYHIEKGTIEKWID